jgi:hypothetical protein
VAEDDVEESCCKLRRRITRTVHSAHPRPHLRRVQWPTRFEPV